MWYVLETVAGLIALILSFLSMFVASYLIDDLTKIQEAFAFISSAMVFGPVAFKVCKRIRKKYNKPEGGY